MLSKTQIKQITALSQKKIRDRQKMFVAEGIKLVEDLLHSGLVAHQIYSKEPLTFAPDKVQLISERDLKKISSLKTPQTVVGVFEFPTSVEINFNRWIVVLDTVRDPGNLGTIIRLCDWFGVENLVCSPTTVDCFNPKVVQATMGSIARVSIHYLHINNFLKSAPVPVYGTFLEGTNVYQTPLPDRGILVLGNEAQGISEEVSNLCTHKLHIPAFGKGQTESLNVASATAIFLSEINRFTEK